MTTSNHLSLELPQACYWKLPMADHHHHHYYYYSQQQQLQEQQQQQQRRQQEEAHQREHLFEKPLTPSDVGKLNRLVIPKQHAEKHFPLDGESGEKGLLLSFEDESGKAWRFRYSYWTSSQSYVLTKGWSRFVKEKRLDAGDIVIFERRRSDADRLHIGWKRRGEATAATAAVLATHSSNVQTAPWNPVFYGGGPQPYPPANASSAYTYTGGAVQQDYAIHADAMTMPEAAEPVPAATITTSTAKRLRLFGVNMECGLDQPESPDSATTIHGQGQVHQVVPRIDPRELQLLPCYNGSSNSQLVV